MNGRVVLLAGDGPSTRMVYHALRPRFEGLVVVLEIGPRRPGMILRRVRKLGIPTVLGQLLFMGLAMPALRRLGSARIGQIKEQFGLDDSPIDGTTVAVPSVNSPEARRVLEELCPAVVVVSGTRMIGRATLAAARAPFINMHAGITPLYRGVHGGYWALAEGRPDLAGTTVHLVDEGIDTGRVIAQGILPVSRADSFATYPYLHTAIGIPLLVDAVEQALRGTMTAAANPRQLPSALRSHPTLWGYLRRRAQTGAR